jgi:hypothetical protein
MKNFGYLTSVDGIMRVTLSLVTADIRVRASHALHLMRRTPETHVPSHILHRPQQWTKFPPSPQSLPKTFARSHAALESRFGNETGPCLQACREEDGRRCESKRKRED